MSKKEVKNWRQQVQSGERSGGLMLVFFTKGEERNHCRSSAEAKDFYTSNQTADMPADTVLICLQTHFGLNFHR